MSSSLPSEYFQRECPKCGEFAYTGYFCTACNVQSRDVIFYTPVTDGTREGVVEGCYDDETTGKVIYQITWRNQQGDSELFVDEFAILSEKATAAGHTKEALAESYDAIRSKLWEVLEREIRPLVYGLVPEEYDPEFVINHLQLKLLVKLDANHPHDKRSFVVDGDPAKESRLSWYSRGVPDGSGRSRMRVRMLRAIPEEGIEIGASGNVKRMYRDRNVLRYDIDFETKIVMGLVEGMDFEQVVASMRFADDSSD